jgi:hypothetical protein
LSQSINSTLTIKIPTMIVRIFLALGAIIAYALALITFVGTSTSTSLSNFTMNIPPENKTDESGTNASEIEPPQGLTPPESLTLGGLSPQGSSDLSIGCSWAQPREPC